MGRATSSKSKRIWTASVAGVLTAAIVGGAVYYNSNEAEARMTLNGIDKLTENARTSPFYILEIVPTYNSAKMGFLVANEEPATRTEVNPYPYPGAESARGIHDMASMDEIKDANRYINNSAELAANYTIYNSLLSAGAFKYDNFMAYTPEEITALNLGDQAKSAVITGTFIDNTETKGWYEPATAGGELNDDYKLIQATGSVDPTSENAPLAAKIIERGEPIFQYRVGFSDVTSGDTKYELTLSSIGTSANGFVSVPIIGETVTLTSGGETKTFQRYNAQLFSRGKSLISATYVASADLTADPNKIYYVAGADGVFNEISAEDAQIEMSKPADDASKQQIYVKTGLSWRRNPDGTPDYSVAYNSTDYTEPFTMEANSYLYSGADSSVLTYIGVVNGDGTSVHLKDGSDVSVSDYAAANMTGIDTNYYCLTQSTAGEEMYYISGVTENPNATFTKVLYNLDEGVVYNPNTENQMVSADAIQYLVDNGGYEFFYIGAGATIAGKYTYSPTKTGHFDFVSNYSAEMYTTLTYVGGYTNSEWFKQFVLDVDPDKCGEIIIDVVTKKANEVTEEDINNAGLIYFGGGGTYDEMDAKVANLVISEVVTNHKAVMLEKSTLASNNNVGRVATALMRPEITTYTDEQFALIQVGQGIITSKDPTKDSSFINTCVFINDDTKIKPSVADDFNIAYTDDKILNGFEYEIPNGDGTNLTGRTNGFKDVLDANEYEAFLLEVAGYTKDQIKQIFNADVSKATCIRYILSYNDKRSVVKSQLRILDLEPYFSPAFDAEESNNYSSHQSELGKIYYDGDRTKEGTFAILDENRDIFSIDWFNNNIGSTANKISVEGMGVKEYIGHVNDICSEYDLIYIGLDTAYMNTEVDMTRRPAGTIGTKMTRTLYNNAALNGLVYTHVGDTHKIRAGGDRLGNADSWVTDEGLDITPDKLRELQNYVKAGYAVLLSDDFFKKDTKGGFLRDTAGKLIVNDEKIDSFSYMYDFVYWCVNDPADYINKNVSIKYNFTNDLGTTTGKPAIVNAENYTKYINISKLYIDEATFGHPDYYYNYVEGHPVPQEDDYTYLKKNDAGVYSLDFTVKLINDAAVDAANSTYDCKLYLDMDGDGRYEDNDVEVLGGLDITDTDGNGYGQSEGKYHLSAGKTYRISRQVPDGYVGFLSWKIAFFENGTGTGSSDTLVRVSKQGYSAVPDYQNKPEIHVLQLISGNGLEYERDAQGNIKLDENGKPLYKNVGTELNLDERGELKDYYSQVKDFSIKVDVMSAVDFQNLYVNQAADNRYTKVDIANMYYDYMANYDMVVMGFIDGFEWPNNKTNELSLSATMGIRKYILEGRSMLFTHDLNSASYLEYNWKQYWGYLFNMYLRDLQGMDRYGLLSKSSYFNYNVNRYEGAFTQVIDGQSQVMKYESLYDDMESNGDEYRNNIVWSSGRKNLNRWARLGDRPGYNKDDYAGADVVPSVYNGWISVNDAVIARWGDNTYGPIALQRTVNLETYNGGGGRRNDYGVSYLTRKVTSVNDGQITQYPFHLTEGGINVAETHPQYLALNLETDSTDKNDNDDIVVWYCISDTTNTASGFGANFNDVRNNYYIYNKGNVTYTGSGHSRVTSDEEKKLFVNTLVLAYNNGIHPPYAAYKENAWDSAPTVTSIYLPYDMTLKGENEGNGGFLVDEKTQKRVVTVNYKTINLNLRGREAKLFARYYYRDENGAYEIEGKKYTEVPQDAILSIDWVKTEKDAAGNRTAVRTAVGKAPTSELENSCLYQMVIDLDGLGISDNLNKDKVEFYVRLSNDVNNIVKNDTKLPSSDSIRKLDINFTRLYEMR